MPRKPECEVLLFAEGDREWAALLKGGRLEDLVAEDGGGFRGPRRGAVHVGRVDRLSPGGRVAFVDLGGGQSGMLTAAAGLDAGDRLLLQVDRYAVEDKAPRVTEAVSAPGYWLVAVRGSEGVRCSRRMPGETSRDRLVAAVEPYARSMRVVVRTAAQHAELTELTEEAEDLRDQIEEWEGEARKGEPRMLDPGPGPLDRAVQDWFGPEDVAVLAAGGDVEAILQDVAEFQPRRCSSEEELLEHRDLASQIRALLDSRVDLKGGGWMRIEQTSALVAVDVNSGGRFLDRRATEALGVEAAGRLPAELRMRGLGGVVVVDFPPFGESGDEAVGAAMERAVHRDVPGLRLMGWTKAGLYELVRKRDRRPLPECFPNGV